ncbi:hypothetical protein Achl_4484 (plasmid) [Pseudarthrobacter chlorophenolicus A6]|uniref:Uncharacterized protein n=1 Tax=Pseudarthrobacter chlorophenolicus (strain ATCC 700700 / DSM 12829 / CIP 107037 / JCM 12360 / KCTC 9906 / NCIMB 13794 / A6) TaxID=452863 RepID=B8HJ38_PSECP|nr:hypothetical protein [Pseudarthrobacter chlorophenolicus]ACL42435.1 hypothetical protein Achl_4484 [Pseudarthrobacter chlorophenolicus A6]SDQ18096.1 hypothetical protein SAMN04489738_0541 [Pseudarthrobacter chlorophenolicus]
MKPSTPATVAGSLPSHREPEVTLESGFDARYWGLPAFRPGAWAFGDDASAEIVAGSVVDGPLSRAAARPETVDAFKRLQEHARARGTADGDGFAAGLEDGIRVLCGADEITPVDELLQAAVSMPTTRASRTNWQLGLRRGTSKAGYRGRLAAGVVLSGADQWWGIADDMDLAIDGPANPKPRFRGAWASLASP